MYLHKNQPSYKSPTLERIFDPAPRLHPNVGTVIFYFVPWRLEHPTEYILHHFARTCTSPSLFEISPKQIRNPVAHFCKNKKMIYLGPRMYLTASRKNHDTQSNVLVLTLRRAQEMRHP